MKDDIKIGQVITTHGIKGEIKIKSDFKYKEKVFKKGFRIYINHQEYTINTYRIHKGYDMVTLDGFDNINQILFMMKKEVFVKRSDIKLENNEYLDSDLMGFTVMIEGKEHGFITKINNMNNNKLLVNFYLDKEYLIPYHQDFIKEIDFKNKVIIINYVEGLF